MGQGRSDRDREQNDFGESYFEFESDLTLSESVEELTETQFDRSESAEGLTETWFDWSGSVGCAIEPWSGQMIFLSVNEIFSMWIEGAAQSGWMKRLKWNLRT